MTRQEFLNRAYNGIWELLEIAQDYGHWAESIIDEDQLDEDVSDDLYEAVNGNNDYGWEDIRDRLCNIPSGYDLYTRDGFFNYNVVEMTEDEIRDDLYNWLFENGYIDDEDEDGETVLDIEFEESSYEEFTDALYEDATDFCAGESIALDTLLSESQTTFCNIREKQREKKQETDKVFQKLMY